jgi:fido (protein-threonine AMPylation protein)
VPVAWEDPPGFEVVIEANVKRVLEEIASSVPTRLPPTVDRARYWHRELYEGIPRPVDYYAGEIRDSDARFPELIGYEVEVSGAPGVPSAMVPAALERFQAAAQAASARLDAEIDPSSPETAALTSVQLHGVFTLCAFLHGEWVRIHPFANGNGRTARLWANWGALRYGLPPFVTVKPRPGHPYAAAGMASMRGDHRVALAVFHQMLLDFLAEL